MARRLQEVDLKAMSETIRAARERRGMTLEELSHALRLRGYPTSQNKLWRMENNPPRRVDTELVLWLEKILDVSLISPDEKRQVLIDDVVELVDTFLVARATGTVPNEPANASLVAIHTKLIELVTLEQRAS